MRKLCVSALLRRFPGAKYILQASHMNLAAFYAADGSRGHIWSRICIGFDWGFGFRVLTRALRLRAC